MPLPALPPDPQPTDADLVPFLDKLRHIPAEHRQFFAELEWKEDFLRRDDSAFLVPFATETQEYRTYGKSDIWREIRKRVLEAAGRQCVGCGGKATQVHHRDYRPSVLRGENDLPLVALCKTCHDTLHAGPKTKTWEECERDLHRLVAAKEARDAANSPASVIER